MKVLRAILGALCGYLIFALTGVALGVLSGRNLHAAQPLWFVALTAGYGVLSPGLVARGIPNRTASWVGGGRHDVLAGARGRGVARDQSGGRRAMVAVERDPAHGPERLSGAAPAGQGARRLTDGWWRSTTRRQADGPHMRMETGESTSVVRPT